MRDRTWRCWFDFPRTDVLVGLETPVPGTLVPSTLVSNGGGLPNADELVTWTIRSSSLVTATRDGGNRQRRWIRSDQTCMGSAKGILISHATTVHNTYVLILLASYFVCTPYVRAYGSTYVQYQYRPPSASLGPSSHPPHPPWVSGTAKHLSDRVLDVTKLKRVYRLDWASGVLSPFDRPRPELSATVHDNMYFWSAAEELAAASRTCWRSFHRRRNEASGGLAGCGTLATHGAVARACFEDGRLGWLTSDAISPGFPRHGAPKEPRRCAVFSSGSTTIRRSSGSTYTCAVVRHDIAAAKGPCCDDGTWPGSAASTATTSFLSLMEKDHRPPPEAKRPPPSPLPPTLEDLVSMTEQTAIQLGQAAICICLAGPSFRTMVARPLCRCLVRRHLSLISFCRDCFISPSTEDRF